MEKEDKKRLMLFIVIGISIVIVWIVFIATIFIYSNNFWFDLNGSVKIETLGVFGDSFNILTSLFTGLAFAGVIISVILQTKELEATRKEFEGQKDALVKQKQEMEQQSFDNRFFQMLNRFNKIREKFVEEERITQAGNSIKINHIDYFLKKFSEDVKVCSKTDCVMKKFESLVFEENEKDFKYYFINLYQILKFIDKFYDKKIDEAKFYTNMIRAQFTSDETHLLFLYIFVLNKIRSGKYMELVKKYSLLEHLDYNKLKNRSDAKTYTDFIDEILIEYEREVFGKSKEIIEQITLLKKE